MHAYSGSMVSMHGNVVILPRSPEGTYVGGDLPQTGCGHRLESESSTVSYARQSTSSQMISVRRSALTELDATAAGALVSSAIVAIAVAVERGCVCESSVVSCLVGLPGGHGQTSASSAPCV